MSAALGRRFCTLDEAAAYLSVSTDTVRRLLRRGELEGRKIGGSVRVEVSSLDSVGEPLAVPKR